MRKWKNLSSTEEDEETKPDSSIWPLLKFAHMFQIAQTLQGKIMEYDLWMECSIKVICVITKGLQPLQKPFWWVKKK
jgi:hypothetical protein